MEKLIQVIMLICKLICCAVGMAMVTTGFVSFFLDLKEAATISLISTLCIFYFMIEMLFLLIKWEKFKF